MAMDNKINWNRGGGIGGLQRVGGLGVQRNFFVRFDIVNGALKGIEKWNHPNKANLQGVFPQILAKRPSAKTLIVLVGKAPLTFEDGAKVIKIGIALLEPKNATQLGDAISKL